MFGADEPQGLLGFKLQSRLELDRDPRSASEIRKRYCHGLSILSTHILYYTENNLTELEHKEPKILASLLLSQLSASEHRVIAPELPLFMRLALQGKIYIYIYRAVNIVTLKTFDFLIWKFQTKKIGSAACACWSIHWHPNTSTCCTR